MTTLRTLRSVIDDTADDLNEPRAVARAEVLRCADLPADTAEDTLVHEHLDGSIDRVESPHIIGRKFGWRLLCAVGAATYAEIVRRNNATADGSCASHDFCDANLIMEAALREYDIEVPECDDPYIDADTHQAITNLWNAAWAAWRAAPVMPL